MKKILFYFVLSVQILLLQNINAAQSAKNEKITKDKTKKTNNNTNNSKTKTSTTKNVSNSYEKSGNYIITDEREQQAFFSLSDKEQENIRKKTKAQQEAALKKLAKDIDLKISLQKMLYDGIDSNDIEKVTNAIDNGAIINLDHMQLMLKQNNPNIFKILIDQYIKQKPNEDIHNDFTLKILFIDCIKNNNLNYVKILLNVGLEPNDVLDIKDPLMLATKYSTVDMVKELLDRGADINYKDEYGQTLFHIAAEHGKADILHLFLTDPKTKNKFDVNEKTDFGQTTALHAAATSNNKDTIEFLLNHDANIEDTDEDGNTPLHYAASRNIDTTRALINAGADIKAKSFFGQTPLHHASDSGKTDIVNLLLSSHADIDAKDINGNTALHSAIKKHDYTTVTSLLNHGANIDQTAIDLANNEKEDHPGIIDLLEQENNKRKKEYLYNKDDRKEKERLLNLNHAEF